MSQQPKWECIGQLGDESPTEYGGYWIFRDKTGVYAEEAEHLECPNDDESNDPYYVHRFILEPCTFVNGVLSDNSFHPEHAAWWASDLPGIASSMGTTVEDLVKLFCSADALDRAQAYRMVGDFHGFINLDGYPLELTRREVRERYLWHRRLKVHYLSPDKKAKRRERMKNQ